MATCIKCYTKLEPVFANKVAKGWMCATCQVLHGSHRDGLPSKSRRRKPMPSDATLAKYGLSPAAYTSLFIKQNGRCAICGGHNLNKPLVIDHDHETGVVRGLLCGQCNLGLGYYHDDPIALHAAATYLEQFADRDSSEP